MLTLTAFLRQILPAGDYMFVGGLLYNNCVVKFRFWKVLCGRIREVFLGIRMFFTVLHS